MSYDRRRLLVLELTALPTFTGMDVHLRSIVALHSRAERANV